MEALKHEKSTLKRISDLFEMKNQENSKIAPDRPKPQRELPIPIMGLMNNSDQGFAKTVERTNFNFEPENSKNRVQLRSYGGTGLSLLEEALGVKEQAQWQAFHFEGKFILSRKGRHYMTKMPNKMK